MSEADPLNRQHSHQVRPAQALVKVRLVPCRPHRTRSTRPICRRMGRNHRHIRYDPELLPLRMESVRLLLT